MSWFCLCRDGRGCGGQGAAPGQRTSDPRKADWTQDPGVHARADLNPGPQAPTKGRGAGCLCEASRSGGFEK